MRVYEVAKLFNVSNKELVELLSGKGFEVKSHMSALSQDALDFLDKHFEKKKDKPKLKKEKVSQVKVVPTEKEIIQEPTKEKPAKELISVDEFIIEPMTVGQVAQRLDKPVSEIILILLKQGIVSPKNQLLSEKSIELLAKHYGLSVKYPGQAKKEVRVGSVDRKGAEERLPVVVVLGHVDHGKTTLLDYVRKTKVALKEKGGITQHLGAYEAQTPQGGVVFIDTPGHEAFSSIRGRGVNVADLAVLIIAADDSIKPQTIEAINKIKIAGIPVIVAINKMDKAEKSRIEVVKSDLARYDLLPEEWGGETILVPISAKTGEGVDALLEMIVLQAQLMDLRADVDRPAVGFILESKLEKGLGPVATVICQRGTARIGDYFVAGNAYGKISLLLDSYGRKIKKVGPSVPVLVSGFNELAQAGDSFEVVPFEKFSKVRNAKDVSSVMRVQRVVADEAIKIIVKTDTTSSKEALMDSIEKLSGTGAKDIYVVHAGIGDISESDVTLATDTGSMIIGLHTKVDPNTITNAQKNIVRIMRFDIIYKLIEYLEALIKQEEPVKLESKRIGEAVVRKVFAIKDVGVIAGSYVKEGIFSRQGRVVGWRGKQQIGEGPIKSLERNRKAVKEVHAGFEFAFLVEGIDDWQIDDRVECYLDVPKK